MFALTVGCASHDSVRSTKSSAELVAIRRASDLSAAQALKTTTEQLLARTKREYDEFASGRGPEPVINVLIISGGGDWGAFGAGFLKGWRRVPAGPMAEPQFDVVTGDRKSVV